MAAIRKLKKKASAAKANAAAIKKLKKKASVAKANAAAIRKLKKKVNAVKVSAGACNTHEKDGVAFPSELLGEMYAVNIYREMVVS